MAQGNSWFDYLPGTDLIDCLNENHGHVFSGADDGFAALAKKIDDALQANIP
ncbi:MAG: hypothetical protein WCF79_18365 [Rhodomicrobium sp.]